MAKFELKLKAHEMRRQGISIIRIARDLKISKGTASMWCQSIVLTKEQKDLLRQNSTLAGANGRLLGAEGNRQKRLRSIQEAGEFAQNLLGKLSTRDLLILGLGLYWAEGSKTRASRFAFVNADSTMILIIVKWLINVLGVKKEDFILRVAINEMHRPREAKVLEYWSTLLGMPLGSFRATSFIKNVQKKVYDNHDTYYGTLIIRLHRSNWVWYRILESIRILKASG